MLDTTANGSCGSRGSSRVGSKVDSGATGFSGESKTGRFLGAQAAIWAYGAATFKRRGIRALEIGGALDRRVLRPVFPRCHAVHRRRGGGCCAVGGEPSGSVWIAPLHIGTQHLALVLGPPDGTATLSAL